LEGGVRDLQGGVDVGRVGDRHLGEGFAGRGIDQFDVLFAHRSNGFAPDKVVQTTHDSLPVTGRLMAQP